MPRSKSQKEAEQNGAQKGISTTNDDVVKEVAKRRRPDRTEALSVHAEDGDNRKYLTHSLNMWGWERPDMTDTKAVADRIQQYFQLCADDDMKPSVEGLAVAFSTDRKTLWRWAEGAEGGNRSITDETRHVIKKAYTILNLQMVDYMQNGRINPVAGIFLMKNGFAYNDQTEVVLTPNNPAGDAASHKQLEEYIIETTGEEVHE